MSHDVMELDLTRIEVTVKMNSKTYVLREATEEAARTFENARLACNQYSNDGGTRSIRGLADVRSLLVSLCLFELEIGADNSVTHERAVQLSQVRSWPTRITKELFEKAKEISELDVDETLEGLRQQRAVLDEQIKELEKEEEKAKNSESDTTDGFA